MKSAICAGCGIVVLALLAVGCAANYARVTEYGGQAEVALTGDAVAGGCQVSVEGDPGRWVVIYDGVKCDARLMPPGGDGGE